GGRVVPGGTGQHGRLALRRSPDRAGARRDRRQGEAAALCRPPRIGVARDRILQAAQCRADEARRRSADDLIGRAFPERIRTMAVDIKVPALGESVTEATVAKWFKNVGDAVAADEPLVELETDKVTVEVPSPSAGTIAEIK